MRCSSGTPKAKVLPIPVRACPIRSSPVRASGSVSSWMANGCSMPFSLSARTISSRTPRSAKVASTSAAIGLGVVSGVMRETHAFRVRIRLVNRCGHSAHQLTFEYVSDSRGPALLRRGQLRARTLHRQRWYGSTTVTWIDCSWWVPAGPIRGIWRAGGSPHRTPVGDRQGGFAGRSGSPHWTPRVGA